MVVNKENGIIAKQKNIQWIMALDVGQKKTGVAVGQTITKTAKPLKIIHCPIGQLKASLFAEIVKEWRIDAIVIGLPVHKDTTEHPLHKSIIRLVEDCQLEFALPVFVIEEYLTSHEAKKRDAKARYIDAMAASIIAEDWLAQNVNEQL